MAPGPRIVLGQAGAARGAHRPPSRRVRSTRAARSSPWRQAPQSHGCSECWFDRWGQTHGRPSGAAASAPHPEQRERHLTAQDDKGVQSTTPSQSRLLMKRALKVEPVPGWPSVIAATGRTVQRSTERTRPRPLATSDTRTRSISNWPHVPVSGHASPLCRTVAAAHCGAGRAGAPVRRRGREMPGCSPAAAACCQASRRASPRRADPRRTLSARHRARRRPACAARGSRPRPARVGIARRARVPGTSATGLVLVSWALLPHGALCCGILRAFARWRVLAGEQYTRGGSPGPVAAHAARPWC